MIKETVFITGISADGLPPVVELPGQHWGIIYSDPCGMAVLSGAFAHITGHASCDSAAEGWLRDHGFAEVADVLYAEAMARIDRIEAEEERI